MDGFSADISDDWEGQWYGPDAAMSVRADHADDPHGSTLSRQLSGYSLNNPVLARIDYRFQRICLSSKTKPNLQSV